MATSASDLGGRDGVAVDLDDLTRRRSSRNSGGQAQVLAPVEEVAVQDAVRARHRVARHHHGQAEPCERRRAPRPRPRRVDGKREDATRRRRPAPRDGAPAPASAAATAAPTSPRTGAAPAGRPARRASAPGRRGPRSVKSGAGKGWYSQVPRTPGRRGPAPTGRPRAGAGALRNGSSAHAVAALFDAHPAVRAGTSVNVCVSPLGHWTVILRRRARSGRGRTAAPSSAARGTRSPPARSCVRAEPVRLHGDTRADRVAVALRAAQPHGQRGVARPRSRCGRGAAAATSAAPSPRGRGRRPGRSRGPRTSDRPGRGPGPRCPTPRRSRPGRRCAGRRCARGWPARRRDQQPVGRAPAVVEGRAACARVSGERAVTWRQKKLSRSTSVAPAVAREHAVHDVEVLPAVAVEVERVRRPGPAAHLRARGQASRPRTCRRRGCGRASCRGRAGGRARAPRPGRRA